MQAPVTEEQYLDPPWAVVGFDADAAGGRYEQNGNAQQNESRQILDGGMSFKV